MKFFSHKPGIERILGLPVSYEVSAGAVIFRRARSGVPEFLLLQYRHRHWDFVKGHVESRESFEETARRETEEETGLADIRFVPGFHRRTHFFYTAKGSELDRRRREHQALWILKTVHFLLAEAPSDSEIRLSDEHLDFVWLPVDGAVTRATFNNAKKLLLLADEFLSRRVDFFEKL